MGKHIIIEVLSELASEAKTGIYLVGGYVRDEIRGIENKDIDITVEGDARIFAEKLSRRLDVRIKKTSQFGTFILFLSGYRIDVATARKENYPSPGALPTVAPGNILEDLSRRDFTINSMAIPIGSSTLIDPFGGSQDLEDGVIRVLHGRSFQEDPTRIFRALRFAERMSFQIERKTISLMREALERRYLTSISPARIRNELSLCFIEKKRYEILQRIGEFGIFKQLNLSYPGKNFFKELDEFAQRYGVESEGLYFVMLADEGDDTSLLTKRDLRLLNSVRIIEKKVPLLRGKTKLGEIYEILDGFPRPSLVYTGVKRRLKKKISLYFEKIEPVRPEITGDDIRNIGISDGKKIGYILRLVKKKKLDGLVSTKDDELNLVREFASNDRPVE